MTIVGILVLVSLSLFGSASSEEPPQNKQECDEHCKKYGGYVDSPPYHNVPILTGKFTIEDGNPHCNCILNDGLGWILQAKGLDVDDFKRSMYEGLQGVRKWLKKHKRKGKYTLH